MRATDDRYRGEQARFELAMRMIRHEARTGTIRYFTGLNDDRIRKLYTTYFKFSDAPVRRQRGRSPTRVGPLVRTPQRALESGVFANLLLANGLLSVDDPPGPAAQGQHRARPSLLRVLRDVRCVRARAARCRSSGAGICCSACGAATSSGSRAATTCSIGYVFDLLSLPRAACPACLLFDAARVVRAARRGGVASRDVSHRRCARRARRAIRCSSPPIATSSTRGPRAPRPGGRSPAMLGGRDLLAGGTWLAVDRRGRFAAVTNIRDGQPRDAACARAARWSRNSWRAATPPSAMPRAPAATATATVRSTCCCSTAASSTTRATARQPRGSARLARVQQRAARRGMAEDRERARRRHRAARRMPAPARAVVRAARGASRLGRGRASATARAFHRGRRSTARVARPSCSSTRPVA